MNNLRLDSSILYLQIVDFSWSEAVVVVKGVRQKVQQSMGISVCCCPFLQYFPDLWQQNLRYLHNLVY